MPFRPTINDKITINRKTYTFTEHPSAKGMPYGQTGRRATAYQVQDAHGQLHALKVFTKTFRTHLTEDGAKRIEQFAHIPGLQVCSRTVITPQSNPALLKQYPDLEYAVLMQWVAGQTWQEIMLSRQAFSATESLTLARNFAGVLAAMESAGIAHCDLSGPNVLVDGTEVALVDVEDLYTPSLEQPEKLPSGSAGYGHKTAGKGLWGANADRFAGAILLAEMLCWHDPRVRQIAVGEQYFDTGELQTPCDRYKVLLAILDAQTSTLAELFAKTWDSNTLDECPRFSQWAEALNSLTGIASIPAPRVASSPQPQFAGSSYQQSQSPAASGPVKGFRKLGGVPAASQPVQQAVSQPAQQRPKVEMPDILFTSESAPGASQIPNPPPPPPWQKKAEKSSRKQTSNNSPQGAAQNSPVITTENETGKVFGNLSIILAGIIWVPQMLGVWMEPGILVLMGILTLGAGVGAIANERPQLGAFGMTAGFVGIIIGFANA